MKSIIIRGVEEELHGEVKKRARDSQKSVNQWILTMLRQITGLEKEPPYKTYHDLDKLAGTWSQRDVEEFAKNTRSFDTIDEDLWS